MFAFKKSKILIKDEFFLRALYFRSPNTFIIILAGHCLLEDDQFYWTYTGLL